MVRDSNTAARLRHESMEVNQHNIQTERKAMARTLLESGELNDWVECRYEPGDALSLALTLIVWLDELPAIMRQFPGDSQLATLNKAAAVLEHVKRLQNHVDKSRLEDFRASLETALDDYVEFKNG